MIYLDPESSYAGFHELDWCAEEPDPEGAALTFLEGEGSILCLHSLAAPEKDSDDRGLELISALTSFVRAARANGYGVARSRTGHVLLEAANGPKLLFDGKTAAILASRLDGKATRIEDRMQMTIRRLQG